MTYILSAQDIEQLKRALAGRLPDAKSSHRAEAMARGLGYGSNAAMLAALQNGPLTCVPDDQAFLGFLSGRVGVTASPDVLTDALVHTKLASARKAIEAVLAREPSLCRNGMRSFDRRTTLAENEREFEEARRAMLTPHAIEEFVRAAHWLDMAQRTARITSRRTSYGYKHDVERYFGSLPGNPPSYVANGMFIAAALHKGFRIRRDDESSPNVLLNLVSPEDQEAKRAKASRPRTRLAGSLRGDTNRKAWRNMMVAGVNAGLQQKRFTLDPDDVPAAPLIYGFELDGLPALACARDAGFGELAVSVAVNPTAKASEWIGTADGGAYAGEAFASGWLERQKGAWLQTSSRPTGRIGKSLLMRIAGVDIAARGYADSGKFMM